MFRTASGRGMNLVLPARLIVGQTLGLMVLICLLMLAACKPKAVCVPADLQVSSPAAGQTTSKEASGDPDIKRGYHIILDRSTGMAGFVHVSKPEPRSARNNVTPTPSPFNRVLGELPSLINAQADAGALYYWGLSHSKEPTATLDPLDEHAFRGALKDCSSPVKCEPYDGWGYVAPVIQALLGPSSQSIAPADLVIIVTDLQPDDQDSPGDGGKIGKALRSIVETGGKAVGLVGVRSRYLGPVNDLPNGQTIPKLNGAQPFFLVIIGPPRVVARLQNRLSHDLPTMAATGDGQAASFHSEIFARHDEGLAVDGLWTGAPAGPSKQVLSEATALDIGNGRQFILTSAAAKPEAPVTEFRYHPATDSEDPTRTTSGVDLTLANEGPPDVHVWMPIASNPQDCAGWRQLAGSPLIVQIDPVSARLIVKVGQEPLEAGFIYRVDLKPSVRVAAVARSFPWVSKWTVKGDWHDEYDEFVSGKRDVVGVANLDTMLEILGVAERRSDLKPSPHHIAFIFRVGD